MRDWYQHLVLAMVSCVGARCLWCGCSGMSGWLPLAVNSTHGADCSLGCHMASLCLSSSICPRSYRRRMMG